MPVGVGENVCQTVLLFDGLSVDPFVCNYTVLCMFLATVCLPVRVLSVYVSVRPCVRLSVFIYICDIVCYSIGLYVFFPFVRQSDRPSILSSSVCMNACL